MNFPRNRKHWKSYLAKIWAKSRQKCYLVKFFGQNCVIWSKLWRFVASLNPMFNIVEKKENCVIPTISVNEKSTVKLSKFFNRNQNIDLTQEKRKMSRKWKKIILEDPKLEAKGVRNRPVGWLSVGRLS